MTKNKVRLAKSTLICRHCGQAIRDKQQVRDSYIGSGVFAIVHLFPCFYAMGKTSKIGYAGIRMGIGIRNL